MRIPYAEDIQISRSRFIIIAALVANSISWYYLMAGYLEALLANLNLPFGYLWNEVILASFFFSIPLSSVAAETALSKVKTKTVLLCWIIIDIATLLLPNLFGLRTSFGFLVFAIWLGFSVGFGFPRCLTYFSDSTSMKERGRVGGVIIFLTYVLTPLVLAATQSLGSSMRLIVYTGWRGLGLTAIPFIGTATFSESAENATTDRLRISQRRRLILYLIPWMTFSLIDGIDTQILKNIYPQETFEMGRMLAYLTGSFSAILGGVAIDLVGRRTSIISSMITLGLGFIAVSLAQTSSVSWLIFWIAEGVAWGVLSITYVLVIWGDLGSRENREKYYAIGTIPFFLSRAVGFVLKPSLFRFSPTHLFSMVILLNFLAVIPLLFVEEVLPLKTREQRRMREYIRRAKQLAEQGRGD